MRYSRVWIIGFCIGLKVDYIFIVIVGIDFVIYVVILDKSMVYRGEGIWYGLLGYVW